MHRFVALTLALAGCGSTPSSVSDDVLDGPRDAWSDLGPGECACSGAIAFALNEMEAPVTSGSEVALVSGVNVLLGQPGPPGFGAAACFSAGSFLQFLGTAFTTLSAHHTLEFVIQPLDSGFVVDWSNDGTDGWRAALDSQTLLASFCAGDCSSPTWLPQGEPRWVAAQWYHVALVRDGDKARSYLGGRLAGEVSGLPLDSVEVPLGLAVGNPVLDAFQGCVAWMRLSPCACYSGDTIRPPLREAE